MISKRAQSQIITTVLIILLVLAAIVIVWQVVQTVVNRGAEDVEGGMDCIGLEMAITKVDARTDKVVARREPGTSNIETIESQVFVDDENKGVNLAKSDGSLGIGKLETGSADVAGLTAGDKVQVSIIITTDDGETKACGLSEAVIASEPACSSYTVADCVSAVGCQPNAAGTACEDVPAP
jgi:hypothetical protein